MEYEDEGDAFAEDDFGEMDYEEEPEEPEAVPLDEEMVECFECGALIPLSASKCPDCGAEFE